MLKEVRRTIPAHNCAQEQVTVKLAKLAVELQPGRPVIQPHQRPL